MKKIKKKKGLSDFWNRIPSDWNISEFLGNASDENLLTKKHIKKVNKRWSQFRELGQISRCHVRISGKKHKVVQMDWNGPHIYMDLDIYEDGSIVWFYKEKIPKYEQTGELGPKEKPTNAFKANLVRVATVCPNCFWGEPFVDTTLGRLRP